MNQEQSLFKLPKNQVERFQCDGNLRTHSTISISRLHYPSNKFFKTFRRKWFIANAASNASHMKASRLNSYQAKRARLSERHLGTTARARWRGYCRSLLGKCKRTFVGLLCLFRRNQNLYFLTGRGWLRDTLPPHPKKKYSRLEGNSYKHWLREFIENATQRYSKKSNSPHRRTKYISNCSYYPTSDRNSYRC